MFNELVGIRNITRRIGWIRKTGYMEFELPEKKNSWTRREILCAVKIFRWLGYRVFNHLFYVDPCDEQFRQIVEIAIVDPKRFECKVLLCDHYSQNPDVAYYYSRKLQAKGWKWVAGNIALISRRSRELWILEK